MSVCVSVCVCVCVWLSRPSRRCPPRLVVGTSELPQHYNGVSVVWTPRVTHSTLARPRLLSANPNNSPTRTFTLSLLARTKKRAFTDRTTLPLLVAVAAAGTLLVWSSCPTSQPPTQHKRKLPRTVHCGLSHQTTR